MYSFVYSDSALYPVRAQNEMLDEYSKKLGLEDEDWRKKFSTVTWELLGGGASWVAVEVDYVGDHSVSVGGEGCDVVDEGFGVGGVQVSD